MTFKINGIDRTIRALGTSDIKRVQKLMNDAILGADVRGIPLDFEDMSAPDFVRLASIIMVYTQDDLFDWLRSFPVPALKEDEDVFEEYPLILKEIWESKQFKAFLSNIGLIYKKVSPEMKKAAKTKVQNSLKG